RLALETPHEAHAEDEIEALARERGGEPIAAHQAPAKPALARPPARLEQHARTEVHPDRDRDLSELGAEPRGSGGELEHATRGELADHAVQVAHLPRVQHRAQGLRLSFEVRLDDARVVVELGESTLRADRLVGPAHPATSRV